MPLVASPSFTIPHGTFRRTQRILAVVLWTIHLEGGKVESAKGHALAELRAAAKRHDMPIDDIKGPSLTVLLQDLDGGKFGNAVFRDDHGSRQKLYAIELRIGPDKLPPDPRPSRAEPEPEPLFMHAPVAEVPDGMTEPLVPVAGTSPNGNGVAPQPLPPGVHGRVEPAPSEPELPLMVRPEPPIDALLHIQSLAAGALIALSQMAGYVEQTTGEARAEDSVQAERLAATLEENQRLRTRVKLQEDTIVAKGKEITGLRKSMLQLQANLDSIRGGGQVNHEALRALREREQLMQEKPRVKA